MYTFLKPEVTVDDVTKMNTLLNNFCKELKKKLYELKRSGNGADDIYKLSTLLFEELTFLVNLKK